MEELRKQLQLMKDKEDCMNVQIKYGRYADTQDWDSWIGQFDDLVTIKAPEFGMELKDIPREQYGESVIKLMRNMDTHHQFTNFLIDVDGDTAICSCVMRGFHVRTKDIKNGDNWQETGGRYTLTLVRKPDGWKIKVLSTEFVYYRGNYNIFGD